MCKGGGAGGGGRRYVNVYSGGDGPVCREIGAEGPLCH